MMIDDQQLVNNIYKILDSFELEYIDRGDRIALSCPIHGSDSRESLTIYTTGDSRVGNFVCWTHHCEQKIGSSFYSLIKFLLEDKLNCKLNNKDVKEKISSIIGENLKLGSVSTKSEKKFDPLDDSLNVNTDLIGAEICKNLKQSDYFISRGFSKDILSSFNVGFCDKKGSEMFYRSVVPVFDVTGKYMIGCIGRSVNEKCKKCGMYHYSKSQCPKKEFENLYAKWRNSKGFYTGGYFYGLWKAKDYIIDTESVILVEGQGDVWRLHEAGFKNSLGLFGDKLTTAQSDILSCLNVKNVIIATDSDDAGAEARFSIRKKLHGYNVYDIIWNAKDCGSLPPEIVRRKVINEYPWLL